VENSPQPRPLKLLAKPGRHDSQWSPAEFPRQLMHTPVVVSQVGESWLQEHSKKEMKTSWLRKEKEEEKKIFKVSNLCILQKENWRCGNNQRHTVHNDFRSCCWSNPHTPTSVQSTAKSLQEQSAKTKSQRTESHALTNSHKTKSQRTKSHALTNVGSRRGKWEGVATIDTAAIIKVRCSWRRWVTRGTLAWVGTTAAKAARVTGWAH